MWLFFTQRKIWRQILFLTLFYSGLIGILSSLSPYLVDRGYQMKEIGAMVGIFGVSTGILFAFLAGIFIRKAGKLHSRKSSLPVFCSLQPIFSGLHSATRTVMC